MIPFSVLIGQDAYVRSGWNCMDGILVFISLIDLAFTAITATENKIFGVLRVFRLLRTLRPLRSVEWKKNKRSLVHLDFIFTVTLRALNLNLASDQGRI